MSRKVKLRAPMPPSSTSVQLTGAATGAPGRARTAKGATAVRA